MILTGMLRGKRKREMQKGREVERGRERVREEERMRERRTEGKEGERERR